MNPSFPCAALTLVLMLAAPALAAAARPATPEEKAAISTVYEATPECSKVVVSERSPRYARWDFVVSDACEPTANGFGIARRDDAGAWRDHYQASDHTEACPVTPLPLEVGVELRACVRPSRHVYLTSYIAGRAMLKPRRVPHGAHSFLGPLRWSGWDHSVAKASGVLDYSDRTARFKASIRVRVWRVRYCQRTRIYTCLSIRFVRSSDRRSYGHFEQTLRLDCPTS